MITYRAPIRLKYHDPVHNHLTHFVVRLQHCCKGWPDDNRKYVSLPPLSPHTTDSPWVPAELRLPKDNDALLSGAVRMDVFAQLDLAQWDPENIRTSTVVEVRVSACLVLLSTLAQAVQKGRRGAGPRETKGNAMSNTPSSSSSLIETKVGLHHDAVVKGDASGKLVLEAKDHDPIVGHHYVSWEWDLSGTAGLLERLCSLESKRVQQQASKLQHVWTTLARQTELDYSAYESNPYYSNWFVTTAIGDVPGWSVMFHLAVEAGCPIPRSLGDGRFPGCIVPDILDRCLEISAKLMDLSWEDLDTLHPAPLVLEWIKNAATLMSSPIPFMEGKVWERGNARPTLTSASRWIFGNPHFRSVADCEDHSTAAALFLLALQFCTWEEDATDPGAPPPYVPKFLSAPKFKWGRRAQRILRQYTVAVAVAKFDAGGDDVKSASSHQFTLLLPTRWLIEDLDNKNNLRASAQTQPVCLVEGTFSSPATARFVKYPGKQLALKNPVSREPMWWGDFCTAVRRSPFDEQLRFDSILTPEIHRDKRVFCE